MTGSKAPTAPAAPAPPCDNLPCMGPPACAGRALRSVVCRVVPADVYKVPREATGPDAERAAQRRGRRQPRARPRQRRRAAARPTGPGAAAPAATTRSARNVRSACGRAPTQLAQARGRARAQNQHQPRTRTGLHDPPLHIASAQHGRMDCRHQRRDIHCRLQPGTSTRCLATPRNWSGQRSAMACEHAGTGTRSSTVCPGCAHRHAAGAELRVLRVAVEDLRLAGRRRQRAGRQRRGPAAAALVQPGAEGGHLRAPRKLAYMCAQLSCSRMPAGHAPAPPRRLPLPVHGRAGHPPPAAAPAPAASAAAAGAASARLLARGLRGAGPMSLVPTTPLARAPGKRATGTYNDSSW